MRACVSHIHPSASLVALGLMRWPADRLACLDSRAGTPPPAPAVLTRRWITGGSPSVDYAIISIYIDGEVSPSLRFNPGLACGTGFDDDSAVPWCASSVHARAHVLLAFFC